MNTSTALYLGSKGHNGVLDTDQFYKESATFTLPNDISGDYYVFVVTDSGNSVFEQDDVDTNTALTNISRTVNPVTVISRPADLVVTALNASTTVTAGKTARISWSVLNQGTGDTIATRWTDRLIASQNDVLGDSDDVQLSDFTYNSLLLPGGTYSRTEDVLIPFQLVGDYKIFLTTDKYEEVYEGSNESNNSFKTSITVNRQTPDLEVIEVVAPATAASGTLLPISWKVKNTGTGSTNVDYWYDEIFLSSDKNIDANDTLLGTIRHNSTLAASSEYNATADLLLPLNLSGSFYVLVRTDSYSGYDAYGNNNRVLEFSENNNTAFATPATLITLSPVPELTVNSVDAPTSVVSGQSFSLTWSVSNTGASTGERTWYDAVYLSRDQVFDRTNGDIYLGSFIHNGGLVQGQSYTETQSFSVPRGLSGPFYAFVVTDSSNAIDERDSKLNNISYDSNATQVILPPPADLMPVASSLTLPTSANPGEIVTINYTVQNQGGDAALGNWYDALYLSADDQWDINDVQIGLVQHFGDVAGGSSYNESLTTALPGVIPGNYHVLLRSDIRNQVSETNESNNAVSSLGVVAVDFESLTIGGSVAGTLQQGQAIYYKIQATTGQALKLHLDSLDNNSVNELYIRYGQLPTRGQFDRTTDNPFLADPDFVLPVNQDGIYYVMVYGNSVYFATNYTLTATDIPFSVTGVETNIVGNKGQATVKVKGARFANDTTFQLVDSQGNTISQSQVKIKDSTTAFVTFDLKGKKIGNYSIQAIQSSGATTTLTEALTVQEGVGAIINDAVGGPARVWAGQKYPISISYGNSGDTDTAAPLLLIRNKNSSTGINPRYENANQKDKLVQLYGAGADVETGLLRPRESHSIPLYFAHLGDENQGAGVSVETVSTEDSTFINADDWIMLKQSAKPASITDANWSTFWSNIQPGIGDTWGDYAQLITQLSKAYNKPGESICDVIELFARWYADKNSTFFQFHPKPSISGQLIDRQTNLPVTGVSLEFYQYIKEKTIKSVQEVITDQQGYFSISSLSPGTYKVVAPSGYFFTDPNSAPDSNEPVNTTYTVTISPESGVTNLQLQINSLSDPIFFGDDYTSLLEQLEAVDAAVEALINNPNPAHNNLSRSYSYNLGADSGSGNLSEPPTLANSSPNPTPEPPPPTPAPSPGPTSPVPGGGVIIPIPGLGQFEVKETREENKTCSLAEIADNFTGSLKLNIIPVDPEDPNSKALIETANQAKLSIKSKYVVNSDTCQYEFDKTKLSVESTQLIKSNDVLKTAIIIAGAFFPEMLEPLLYLQGLLNRFKETTDISITGSVAGGVGIQGNIEVNKNNEVTGSVDLNLGFGGGLSMSIGELIKADLSFTMTATASAYSNEDEKGNNYQISGKGKFSGVIKVGALEFIIEGSSPPESVKRLPGGINIPGVGGFFEFIRRPLPTPSLPPDCDCKPKDYSPTLLRSADPNDILGPDGYGIEKWVSTTDPLDYTIRFENMAIATAPAKQVVITQKLDSDLDWRSFRLGSFGWGDLVFQAPENRAFYSERIDLTEKYGIYADVTAFIDITTGEAKWEIKAIDPETGDIPTDPLKGFLPPNNESHVGEGFVTYKIKSKSTAQTGDRIDAQARIVFDNNEPIDTPSIFNTLDVGNPISAVDALPSSINTSTFLVKWAGNDNGGSGLATYNVYVSKDNALFELWQGGTTLTEATFTGEGGHTYKFYSLATDNAGNLQDISTATPVTVEILSPGSLAFSAPTFSVSEDGIALTSVTVTRTNGSYGAVEATLNLSGGTATGGTQPYAAGVDYDNSAITVSFADGETSKTITIPINNDTQLESNETINLSLSNPTGGAVIGQQSNAVLTLVDNDTNLNFNLTPEAEISTQVLTAFTEATSHWTSLLSNTAAINVTIGFRDLGVGILAQNLAERSNFAYADVYNALLANRTSTHDFTSVSNLQSGSAFSLLLNRTSNNPAGSGSITPYLDNDGDANNTTIRVNHANAKALGLISANASGQDALLILNSNNSLTWDFDPSDGITPGAYDFVGLVTHEIGHTLGFDSGVDVLDSNLPATDDAYTYVTLMDLFRFSTASTAYGNGVIDWTASTTDKYFSTDGGTNKLASFATAVNYGDGQQSSHWKDNLGLGIMDPTIALGERIQISALDKQMFDVIGWNLLDTNTNYAKLSFSAASFSISEDGTPINAVTVIRTSSTIGSVSATITLSDDTAISGSDYNNTPITVTFASGETSKTVAIPITNDTLIETLENIKLTLSNPTGGATIGIQNTATLSILDDDVQLNFSASNYVVREDGTAVTNIIVTRTGRATGTVGGTITFTDGTAEGCGCGPNSVNKDFHNGAIAFTLGENETSKVIPVELASLGGTNAIRIRNDNKVEGDETFTITLTDPTGGAVIGNQNNTTVTILDDDVELAFSDTNFSINEDGTAIATVTVTRTGRSSGAVGATIITLTNGSAESPADYDSTPIVVNFADGETTKTVLIPIVDDTITESDETITLTLGNPTGNATIGVQSTATLTIKDNDAPITLIGTPNNDTLVGGNGNDTLDGREGDDTLIGGFGNDTLIGGSGNDTLDGGTGNDRMEGGSGNDTYIVDNTGDTIVENTSSGTDTVQASIDLSIAGFANVENLTLTGSAISGRGNSGNNRIIGNALNNILDGGSGNDTLDGGTGDDTYIVDSTSDIVTENASSGIDTVEASVSFSIAGLINVENLTLTGSAIAATGNSLNNRITGNTLDNTLNGDAGNDTLIGGAGNDALNGGTGDDTLIGGAGNDTYTVDSINDTIIEDANAGTDAVNASVSWTLGDNLENLTLTGSATSGTGNSSNNRIIGNSLNNILDGGTGSDTLEGGSGDDTYIVDSTGDTIVEFYNSGVDTVQASVNFSIAGFAEVENLTLIGNAISGTGNSINNRIIGNAQNNILNGGIGSDRMEGGTGDDTYIVDTTSDTVVENALEGTDTIESTVTFSIAGINNVENLTLTGTYSINGTGNALNNRLIGNAFSNTLNGGAGDDTMSGGVGDDTYIVDSAGDTIVENLSSGTDTVQASVNYSIAEFANVENLTLTGNALSGTGNALNNRIIGNTFNNILDGGTGNDTMEGGSGDDTYIVDNAGDTIVESSSSGADTVQASVNFSIAGFAEVENLTLIGNAINGTGNSINNRIIGNAQNNILNGGIGSDRMEGGTGDDTYIVDSSGDTIIENALEGIDTVETSVTFSLAGVNNVENLTLTGSSVINGTGNALDNRIIGNVQANILNGGAGNDTLNGGDGSDTLDGGTGDDTLNGGTGNDTYTVDSTLDSIIEDANAGTDIVNASVSWTLGDNLENLTLTGTSAITGTGNALNNTIQSNSAGNSLFGNDGNDNLTGNVGNDLLDGGTGSDTLLGNSGNDILVGGFGNDTLTGGIGVDTFVLNNPSQGIDSITDFSSVDDTLQVSAFGFGGGLTAGAAISASQILIGSGSVATNATQRFIYNTSTGALFFDADGNQTGFGAVQIATLSNRPTIGASDIFATT